MNPSEIRALYDQEYADSYDEKFLRSPLVRSDVQFELEQLQGLVGELSPWLDVGCGTGYFLSQFPGARRGGIDLSSGMLEKARARNPGADLVLGDFRESRPGWMAKWGLVSCMWYAYTLVETLSEMADVLKNLADWTAVGGTCFLPFADPSVIAGVALPYRRTTQWPGDVFVSGIIWSYVEDGGRKVHRHLIAPQLDWVTERLAGQFGRLDVVQYPHAEGGPARSAIVARKRLPNHLIAEATQREAE